MSLESRRENSGQITDWPAEGAQLLFAKEIDSGTTREFDDKSLAVFRPLLVDEMWSLATLEKGVSDSMSRSSAEVNYFSKQRARKGARRTAYAYEEKSKKSEKLRTTPKSTSGYRVVSLLFCLIHMPSPSICVPAFK